MKTLCILALTFAISLAATAKKIDGIIITKRDTQHVTFKIPVGFISQKPDFEKIQYSVKYYRADGSLVELDGSDADEFQFEHEGELIRMISRPNNFNGGSIFKASPYIFLRLEKEGNLQLFHYYYTQHSPGVYNPATGVPSVGHSYNVEKYVLQKGNEKLERPVNITFRKDMMEYFRDCPELAKKIESKELGKNNLPEIVDYYNEKCIE